MLFHHSQVSVAPGVNNSTAFYHLSLFSGSHSNIIVSELTSSSTIPNNVPITLLASSFRRSYESTMLNKTTGWTRHTTLVAIFNFRNYAASLSQRILSSNFPRESLAICSWKSSSNLQKLIMDKYTYFVYQYQHHLLDTRAT